MCSALPGTTRKINKSKNHLVFFLICYDVSVQRYSSMGMKVGKGKFIVHFPQYDVNSGNRRLGDSQPLNLEHYL